MIDLLGVIERLLPARPELRGIRGVNRAGGEDRAARRSCLWVLDNTYKAAIRQLKEVLTADRILITEICSRQGLDDRESEQVPGRSESPQSCQRQRELGG